MDWIERIIHVDPDGGSGAVELAVLMLVAAVIVRIPGMMRARRVRARERGPITGEREAVQLGGRARR